MTNEEKMIYLTAFATAHASGHPTDACYLAHSALNAAQNHARPVHGDRAMRAALGLSQKLPPAEQAHQDNIEAIVAAAIDTIMHEVDHPHAEDAVMRVQHCIERKLGRPLRGHGE